MRRSKCHALVVSGPRIVVAKAGAVDFGEVRRVVDDSSREYLHIETLTRWLGTGRHAQLRALAPGCRRWLREVGSDLKLCERSTRVIHHPELGINSALTNYRCIYLGKLVSK